MGSRSPLKGRATFELDDVMILQHPAKHHSQWPRRGDFPHAVDQHPDWAAEETVKCHMKFFQ